MGDGQGIICERHSFPGSAWERAVSEAPPRRKQRERRRQNGLTLLEVMLVLGLIVVIASFCWPAINRAFASQRLKKSADIVRTQLCKSRVKAMSSDRIVLFRYEMGGARFRIDQLTDATSFENTFDGATPDAETLKNSALANTNDQSTTTATGASINDNYPSGDGQHSLPKGIIFHACEIENDSRAMTANVGQDSNLPNDAMWSAPIYFYPDGTSSSARMQICNERNLTIELALRGMTGVVKVGEITAAEGVAP
jgi:prepilin-type N-terminal cleavage/methylation domain-containing protein